MIPSVHIASHTQPLQAIKAWDISLGTIIKAMIHIHVHVASIEKHLY